ncbi:MAG: SHOCT domain-containing protein [Halobacteriaceae archaeon]
MLPTTMHWLGEHAPTGQMGMDWTGWGGIFAMIVFALLIAAVALVLVRVLIVPAAETTSRRGSDPARELLRERFARGEIDEEEYERRLERLNRRPDQAR